jgi:hypothetical protein
MPANPNDSATKHDLQALKRDIHHSLKEHEDRLVEKMRDMQTEVLRAFHEWARSMETRTRVLPLHEERLMILEDRVSRIERGERPQHP